MGMSFFVTNLDDNYSAKSQGISPLIVVILRVKICLDTLWRNKGRNTYMTDGLYAQWVCPQPNLYLLHLIPRIDFETSYYGWYELRQMVSVGQLANDHVC